METKGVFQPDLMGDRNGMQVGQYCIKQYFLQKAQYILKYWGPLFAQTGVCKK